MDIASATAWLHTETLWGMSAASLLIAAAAALATYLLLTLLQGWAVARARRAAGEERSHRGPAQLLMQVLSGTSHLLIVLAAVLVGAGMLELPGRWPARVQQLWFLAVALQVGLWGTRATALVVERYRVHNGATSPAQISASATLISWGLRTLLWATVLLAILSNVGVNITAFVASLGVGGIAIALAVQSVLGDLFASVAIAVDKPFEVGDFIVVGGVAGTVQQIGVKTTRISALSGEQVVMSNTDLLKQTINNYRYMRERRILFNFRVPYGTSAETAEAIPQAVRRIIEAEPNARFDRAHLQAFGDHGLTYEVVYIVLDAGYNVYMDLQQKINLALMRELQSLDLAFAIPERRVHVADLPAGWQPPPAPGPMRVGAQA
ncbi:MULTISPECIES: mechanosensitive ion channel family protein [unclassified Acidovorax]|uniref:mechanosensitive ion channel family protein n=1 Tax=unclassified Acidovorax TaxID=2684926 RepID=UPI002882FD47|nr:MULTISPECIES: mechanosensitive ion channel family protein [unclassified Acidovorax]